MRRSIPNGLLGALLALFLAACGGGTPPPPPPSGSITLTVEDPMGSFGAAAYQVGTGSWQTLSMTGGATKTGTFSMSSQTQYGVAVRCNDGSGGVKVIVIQATSTELANPKVVCSRTTPPSPVSFTVNVNISGITVSSGDRVCVNDSNCSPPLGASASSATINANLEPGTRDLLVALKDNSGLLVKVAKVVRGVNVTSGGNTSVSLGSSDQLSPVSFTVPSVPGYTSIAFVGYLSANGTATGLVNASSNSYRPVSGFGSGDLYLATILASGPNAMLMSLQFFNSGAPILAFPAPWSSGSLTVTQTAHPTVTGLTRSDADLQGYAISLTKFAQLYYTAILSKAWLGTANSYTLPDLSSQLGYTPLSNGTNASFSVAALLSNKAFNTNPSALAAFAAGDYIRLAGAFTDSFTVGGGPINLP